MNRTAPFAPWPQNARLWVFVNDTYSRVCLRPGQVLNWGRSERTDEGYSAEYIRWEYDTFDHDAPRIVEETHTDGRDCDGRLSHTWECSAPVARLRVLTPHPDLVSPEDARLSVRQPAWERGRASQRDYTAEAAGY